MEIVISSTDNKTMKLSESNWEVNSYQDKALKLTEQSNVKKSKLLQQFLMKTYIAGEPYFF